MDSQTCAVRVSVRVGTWNVQYGKGEARNARRREVLRAYDADVWVLTETNDDLDLSDDYEPVHSTHRYLPQARGRWVTVWSRLPMLARHDTEDPSRTVAVTVMSDDGPMCVFGSVLPWQHDVGPDPADPAPGWAEFYRVTPLQGAEWRRLRALEPASILAVTGDLNQNLGGPHYYGTTRGRTILRDTLASAGLDCLTQTGNIPEGELDFPPIDHVCAAAPAGHRLESTVHGWRKADRDGMVLSDHSGVVAEIRLLAR
ncbi:MAG: hypothetical protein QOF92_2854 [Pseudonocardiales bacterium]|nr:hypothetical protein [Pseudonocardiales bacterium]